MTGPGAHDLGRVAREFAIDGAFLDGAPHGNGHINDTYAVRFRRGTGVVGYIFQRINHGIFKDITAAELEHLAFSGRLITFEIGMRFLTDYLRGDRYFRSQRPGQNLDRARNQFARVQAMERAADDMEKIVARCRAA